MRLIRKPVIGISASIIVMEGGRFPGYRKSYVNEDYVKSVLDAGAVPLILPMISDEQVISEYISQIDGLVLSGGHDVSPLNYGTEPLLKLGETLVERDQFDLTLVREALAKQIPVLGICRGHQILNVALGGTLHQDLSYIEGCTIKHDQFNNSSEATHSIHIKKETELYRIMGSDRIFCNSFHHLAVKDVADGLLVSALSADGLVEALEHKELPHILSVQWHPEMMAAAGEVNMKKLFNNLVESCKKFKSLKGEL